MKIIWHFKESDLSQEEIERIKKLVKEFHKDSLCVFADNLDIHFFDNDLYHNTEVKKEGAFDELKQNEKGYRNIRRKIE